MTWNKLWGPSPFLRDRVVCDPLTMLLVATTAVSAVGTLSAANAQANADQFNAQVSEDNAKVKAQQDAVATEQRLGQAQAAYGAAGVDPTTGSPLLVKSDIARQGELQRQLDIWSGKVGADASQQAAGAATTAGLFGAGSSILGGAMKIQQNGGFSSSPSGAGGSTLNGAVGGLPAWAS